MNEASKRKRTQFSDYIARKVVPASAVQAIVVIGSVAKGVARDNSDIDAVVFLQPFDLYAVPAEFKWQPEQDQYYGIFNNVANAIQGDFKRVDLAQWSQPEHVWPEAICAELQEGWVAFDRRDAIQPLLDERTKFSDPIRRKRLDEAVVRLDWLLSETTIDQTWNTHGATVAHYRLHAAYDYLIQALFAYNRRWRTFRSRELADLLTLAWLPAQFEEHAFLMMNAPSKMLDGYQQRAAVLRQHFDQLLVQCKQDNLFGEDAVDEAFVRQHDEPGRNWNMDAWNERHNPT